jgi:peptide deformylase
MPSRDIIQLGNPILWEKSSAVEDFSSSLDSLITDLSDTLTRFREANGFGRGIAAPQVGSLARVIFIKMQPSGFCGPLVNPRIIEASDELIELWDDCFSLPGLMVRVKRNRSVRVSYSDERGGQHIIKAEGDFSELLQHEIDHLDGILAIDRAVSPRAIATREEWERQLKKVSA